MIKIYTTTELLMEQNQYNLSPKIQALLKKAQIIKFLKAYQWTFKDCDIILLTDVLSVLQILNQSLCFGLNIQGFFNMSNSIQMLKYLQGIKYTNLTVISLNGFQAHNIQFLSRCQFPALTNMFLFGKSRIFKFQKSLRKCSFPKLQLLNIQNNPIQQLTRFCELKTNKRMQSIVLQMSDKSKTLSQDLSCICKLQIVKLDRIRIASFLRIHKTKIVEMIENKFQEIKFYY